MKNLTKYFCIFIFVAFILTFISPASASEFDAQLDKISILRSGKKHTALITLLTSCKKSILLEDLRQFFLGEALRGLGKDEEAVAVFERLMRNFPETLGGRKAVFPYILSATKIKSPSFVPQLLKLARELPSAYQRGKALEAICKMPLSPIDRGKIALESIREYHSECGIDQKIPESAGLLEEMISFPNKFELSVNEWIEVLMWANHENLDKKVIANLASFKTKFGDLFPGLAKIIEADALRFSNKIKALEKIQDVIFHYRLGNSLKALAHQVRGDIFYSFGRYEAAVLDYEQALEWDKPPINSFVCRYRYMLAAFESGQDTKSWNAASVLCESDKKIAQLPLKLYEMGLKRFDAGHGVNGLPYFQLLYQNFPEHYRADDAIGYSIIVKGQKTKDGKSLIALLRKFYPHSFFLYWLSPEDRSSNFPIKERPFRIPDIVKKRIPAWKKLLSSPFASLAREEIRHVLDENSHNIDVYRGVIDLYREIGDFNQLSGCGERLLRVAIENGIPGSELPEWAWKAYYPKPFWNIITAQAKQYNLDPWWVLAIMREESHFNPKTLSRSNAMGLMQILPSTGKWIATKKGVKGKFRKESLWDIHTNISYGVWYLAYLRDLFEGDLFLASAAYNGGQGNIIRKVQQGPFAELPVLERLDRVPLPETRDYYKKVMGSWWNYRRLYGDAQNIKKN